MKLPVPIEFKKSDVCRDGGTYVVSFTDRKGHWFDLELPVRVEMSERDINRIGYNPPIIKIYDPEIHGNVKNELELSWEQGDKLAEQLRPLAKTADDTYSAASAFKLFKYISLRGALE